MRVKPVLPRCLALGAAPPGMSSLWRPASSMLFAVTVLLVMRNASEAADWATQSFTPAGYYLQWDTFAVGSEGRRLLVSNNPETITPGTARGTLWWDGAVDASAQLTQKNHRIFAWHVNASNDTRVFAVTLWNRSSTNTLQIDGAAGAWRRVPSGYLTAGKELAILMLNGLGSVTPENSTVGPGQTLTIWRVPDNVDNNRLIGLIFGCTVKRLSGTGYIDYLLRTVHCNVGENPASFPNSPPTTVGASPRGSWPHSKVSLSNAGNPFTTSERRDLGFADPYNCPNDQVYTVANSWDSANAKDNTGLFGVTEVATLWVQRGGEAAKEPGLRICMSTRGTLAMSMQGLLTPATGAPRG